MKLFFYSLILANNNLLLKIYCENLVIAFLNCHFLFFILFFPSHHISSIRFFFFLHHTRIPLISSIYLLFSFSSSFRIISSTISLCLSLALFFHFFYFYLILEHSLPLSHKKNSLSYTHRSLTEKWRSAFYGFFFFFISLFYCSDFIRLMREIVFVFQIFRLGFVFLFWLWYITVEIEKHERERIIFLFNQILFLGRILFRETSVIGTMFSTCREAL